MKKRGFTLVELLAVIVILAIIAVIATPIILGVIEKSKKGAAENSALGYTEAVEKQIARNLLDEDATNDITDGVYEIAYLTSKEVKVKGDTPSKGWVKIEKKQVVSYSLEIGDYVVNYNETDKKIESTKNGKLENRPSGGSGETQILPKYFEFGTPTTESTTDYTTLNKNVFATLYSDGITGGVCIIENGLFCIKRKDYDNSVAALKAHFGGSCTPVGSPTFNCVSKFDCSADSSGNVICAENLTNEGCFAYEDGSFKCLGY